MLNLRPLLRQIRRPSNQTLHVRARLQHGSSGPHKEYFQTPAQAQRLVRDFGYRPEHVQQALQASQSEQPSLFRRFLRGTSLFTAFLLVGWFAGQALITWEYYQPHYEVGSEEDQEFLEEINETLLASPLVHSLIEDGWLPSDELRYEVEEGGRHLLHDTLSGVKGVTMRYFRHPTEKAAVIACFMGFGIEGWPDVVHGGTIATLLQEAVNMVVKDNYKDLVTVQDGGSVNVTYRRPVRPGQIYSIAVVPAGLYYGVTPEDNQLVANCYIANHYIATLITSDSAPTIHRSPATDGGITNHTVSGGRSPDDLLAVAEVSLVQLPKQFFADLEAQRPQDEVMKNLQDEFKRLMKKYSDEEDKLDEMALENGQTDPKP